MACRLFREGWAWLVASFLLTVFVPPATVQAASSAGCQRAEIVVREALSSPPASETEHRALLDRLRIVRGLCPSHGELWRLSACSAAALGQNGAAKRFEKRAALGGVDDLSCPGDGHEPEERRSVSELGPVRSKHALVVGIGKFADPEIAELQYTAKDARDFARFLVDEAHFPAANVHLLTDDGATRESILKTLQQMILEVRADDLVALYFSSHGSPYQPGQGLGGIGYLVTHDTSLDSIFVDAIEYQRLTEMISLLPARRIVTFLDSCFSGRVLEDGAKQLVVEGVGVGDETAQLFLSGEGTYLVTSSHEKELSWESDELENSYFTYYLIEALRSGPAPTLDEVFDRLYAGVTRAVARDRGVGQHPQLHPREGPGDLRLGVRPSLELP